MPLYRITVKKLKTDNGIRLEPGMSVEVVTSSHSFHPIATNGGQLVAEAFMRIYGIDIKKAGGLNANYLSMEKLG